MLNTRKQKSKVTQLTLAESTAAQTAQSENEQAESKNQKRKLQDSEDMLAEYLCPITQELPVDPVIAEDGQCYERSAIESWFNKNVPLRDFKSPVTNKTMGQHLVSARQTRSAIEQLVNKGIIVGEAATAWKEKRAEIEGLDEKWRASLNNARRGNALSMCEIGLNYRDGTNGFKKDESKAVEWMKMSAAEEHATAVANMAVFYFNGSGVKLDRGRGMFEMARAAKMGSEHAAAVAGFWFAEGAHFAAGKDDVEATRWFKLSRNCAFKDSVKSTRKIRDDWLRRHGHLEGEEANNESGGE
ncbi:MAG: hypothetical protein CMD92_03710 [Gammaproteobacteria bacterium]|nr:hypothetical protein [Gammaproteobacteria bacterium]|tara:strand:- start:1096 stop:1995 length:900 start_codon:yes stop_codon:yes gene_type:complete